MPKPQPRFDRKRIEHRYANASEDTSFFLDLKSRASNLTLLIATTLDVASCGVALDADHDKIREALRVAAQASAALFVAANSENYPVEVNIEGAQHSLLETRPDESIIHPIRWVQGFFLSAICRQSELIDELCKYPTEKFRESSTKSPQYRYALVDSLKAFWVRDLQCNKLILSGLEATDPERSDVRAVDWTLNIDVPLFQLLFYIANSDSDFADAFPKATALHDRFWTSSKKLRDNWNGFLSIELTGLAALAQDRGKPFQNDTINVPNWLITNCDI